MKPDDKTPHPLLLTHTESETGQCAKTYTDGKECLETGSIIYKPHEENELYI